MATTADRASIWHQDETPGYHKSKAHTSFSKWRVMVMERTAQLIRRDEAQAVFLMYQYGLRRMGLDYDGGVTAEDLARRLAQP